LGAVEHSGELVACGSIKVVGDGFGVEGEGGGVVGVRDRRLIGVRCRIFTLPAESY
jgi:hypothetical protein